MPTGTGTFHASLIPVTIIVLDIPIEEVKVTTITLTDYGIFKKYNTGIVALLYYK
jgi:hypothetical protein